MKLIFNNETVKKAGFKSGPFHDLKIDVSIEIPNDYFYNNKDETKKSLQALLELSIKNFIAVFYSNDAFPVVMQGCIDINRKLEKIFLMNMVNTMMSGSNIPDEILNQLRRQINAKEFMFKNQKNI